MNLSRDIEKDIESLNVEQGILKMLHDILFLLDLIFIHKLIKYIDTSGTTGAPKGVVRDTGGTVVALNWCMKNVFNIH